MSNASNRREFIKSTAALGAGAWVLGGISPKPSLSANEEIRFACIGVGGKGSSDTTDAGRHGKVVAMCDIDANILNAKTNEFPDAATYSDYRKMLDEMEDRIDAVTVSTPDHTHAVISLYAMQMGKHIFCQKPLSHSIEESRLMGQMAADRNLVTQMGNQGNAGNNLRISAALVRAGVIGRVREVHVWTNRPVWPQSAGLEIPEMATPSHIDWNSWIGPARMRAYSPEIHPFKWRGFWEFGTGALGDMACHTLSMPYLALDLKFPTAVQATFDRHDKVFYPSKSKIEFEFPELNGRAPLKVFWYDGGAKPDESLMAELPKQQQDGGEFHFDRGALLIGDQGKFYSPGDYGEIPSHTGVIIDGEFTPQRRIVRPRDTDGSSPFSQFKDIDYVRSPGHFTEFANAIKGEGTPISEFVHSAGPFNETILLGNLALWSGERIDWDAKEMIAKGASEEIQRIVRKEYHNGYSIHEFAVSTAK